MFLQPEELRRGVAGNYGVASPLNQLIDIAERLVQFFGFGRGRSIAPKFSRTNWMVFRIEHNQAVLLVPLSTPRQSIRENRDRSLNLFEGRGNKICDGQKTTTHSLPGGRFGKDGCILSRRSRFEGSASSHIRTRITTCLL